MAVGVMLAAAPALKAEHAKIELSVSSQGKEATASADRDPPPGGLNDPPVLNVEVTKPLVLQFILTNANPHGVLEHVTVRYYVVRVAKLGRKPGAVVSRAGLRRRTAATAVGRWGRNKRRVHHGFQARLPCRHAVEVSHRPTGHLFGSCRNRQHAERSRAFFGHRSGGQIARRRSVPRAGNGACRVGVSPREQLTAELRRERRQAMEPPGRQRRGTQFASLPSAKLPQSSFHARLFREPGKMATIPGGFVLVFASGSLLERPSKTEYCSRSRRAMPIWRAYVAD